MEFITFIIDLMSKVDVQLLNIINHYGSYTYAILFLIIFCETGLVVMPFLPGDSLLFVSGAFAAAGLLEINELIAITLIGAVLGNTVNYEIGRRVGLTVGKTSGIRFINRKHLQKTKYFFNKYGIYSVVLSRFIPIVRTIAPFFAGMCKMPRLRFFVYNLTGGIVWTILFLMLGYLFGNIDFVKNNYSLVISMIVVVSFMPVVAGFFMKKNDEEWSMVDQEELI